MQIYKYQIDLARNRVEMPRGAQILSIGVQFNLPVVWALVPPDAPKLPPHLESYPLAIYLTGRGAPTAAEAGRFLGTLVLDKGNLVLHIWDQPERMKT